MKKNIYNCIPLIIFLLIPLFISSCKDDVAKPDLFEGLWLQQSISEDGQEMTLSEKEQNLKLLIENNGVYRTHTNDATGPTEYYGAWTITDNKWIEFSINTWILKKNPLSLGANDQWSKNHVLTRFTILSIDNTSMKIRIKTYVGNKKYSPLFTEHERPVVTTENYDQIDSEYKELKTYIFTFKKVE